MIETLMHKLEVLVPLAGIGAAVIALVALYTHLAGLSKKVQLSGPDEAKNIFRKIHNETPITNITLSADNCVALARFKDESQCLLHSMGDKWVVHPLGTDSIRKIKATTKVKGAKGALRLDFRDYAAPHLTIVLDTDEARDKWRTALLAEGI